MWGNEENVNSISRGAAIFESLYPNKGVKCVEGKPSSIKEIWWRG